MVGGKPNYHYYGGESLPSVKYTLESSHEHRSHMRY
jgi:hypothetical protein